MSDKTEDEKPQLVPPPIPTGNIYEPRRPLSPPIKGRAGAAADADAAAATAAATSVEPGLQAAILKLLPKWGPLVKRVEALEQAIEGEADPRLSQEFLEDFEEMKEGIEKHLADREDRLDGVETRINERLDALASVVSELREELGVEEAQGTEEAGTEEGD